MAAKIQDRRGENGAQACCGRCVHFCNDPASIESAFKGLTAMSSGHASVRSHDGLCGLHDLYLSYRDRCADFSAAEKPHCTTATSA
jgi:hypothetical protein